MAPMPGCCQQRSSSGGSTWSGSSTTGCAWPGTAQQRHDGAEGHPRELDDVAVLT
jgi:hypothetical protein